MEMVVLQMAFMGLQANEVHSCSYQFCPGLFLKPALNCAVCHADVHGWELLAGNTKADLCLLARTLGIKVSMRVPGQGPCDQQKDTIICKLIEKKYVDAHTSAADTTPQINTENATIHYNFCLINIIFLDVMMAVSDQCGNLTTRNELDIA
jgi:hypothetical protein